MLIWTSRNIPNVGLFSAYAEVFLVLFPSPTTRAAFLCLRRGVSKPRVFRQQKMPAFLCLRRGVSIFTVPWERMKTFSLPTQRCFCFSALAQVTL